MKVICITFLFALFSITVFSQGVSVDSLIKNMGPCGGIDSASFSYFNTTTDTDKILVSQNPTHPPQDFLIIDVDSLYSNSYNRLFSTIFPLCWNGHVTTYLGVDHGLKYQLESKQDIVVLFNNSNTHFTDSITGISAELIDYAQRGGTVIILGSSDTSFINNTNLLNCSQVTSVVSPDTASFLASDPRDPILSMVTQPLHGAANIYSAKILDTDFVNVVNYNGQTIAGYKTVGWGKVVYLGFSFNASFINPNFKKLIENIFEVNNSSWSVIPQTYITVPPFDTALITIYFNISNPGNTILFTKDFKICSEDSLLPCWHVIARANLERRPCAIDSISYNSCSEICMNNHSLKYGIFNYMDFGDGYVSTSAMNPCHNYADTGTYFITCIANSTYGADTTYDTAYVNILAPQLSPLPSHSPPSNSGIYHFVFDSIDYSSGHTGYEDLTCIYQDTVTEGNYYQFFIETGSGYGRLYIFLDMNDDGAFTPDELLYQKFSPHTLTDSIAIPKIRSGKYNTPLRLRVMVSASYNIPFTISSNSSIEIEDYTLFVRPNNAARPLADFCYFHDCSGLGVQFRNTSGGAPDSLVWIFSDGTLDTGIVPFHTFPSLDSQVVTLQAYNSFGSDFGTKVLLNPKKPAILYSSPVVIGDTVVFSTLDYPGIFWWWWTFPDLGTYVNDTVAVRTFSSGGNFSVTLAIMWLYETYTGGSYNCNGLNSDSIIFVSVDIAGIHEKENNLSIVPNPFRESASVIYRVDSKSKVVLELFDLSGNRIWREEDDLIYGKNEKVIRVTEPGSYILRVTSGSSEIIRKIISIK